MAKHLDPGDGLGPLAWGDYIVDLFGRPFRASEARKGFQAMGVQRSGKSSACDYLLREAVKRRKRVIAVDFEGNLSERLKAVAPPGYLVRRFDVTGERGTAAKFCGMLRSQTQIQSFAERVSPTPPGSQNAYFDDSSQMILIAAATLLNRLAPEEFTLGDLIRLTEFPELIVTLCEDHTDIKNPFEHVGLTRKSSLDVLGTVASKLFKLKVYAALCERAAKSFDPMKLIHGPDPSAVVLVFSDRYKHILEGIYSFILDTIAYEKLSMPGDTEQLHMSFDEIASLKPLDSLPDIARRGAKAYICWYLTAHSVESVYQRYGKEGAGDDILNLAAYHIFFRMGGRVSAQFASDVLGVCEVIETIPQTIQQHGSGDHTPQLTYIKGAKERAHVHWDELRRCPLASWEDDSLSGYLDTPTYTRAFRDQPFRHMVETSSPPKARKRAPAEWELLRPWSPTEASDRLNISFDTLNKARKLRMKNRKQADQDEEQTP